jgi:UDP-N-acetyl-2-amino-2-deoxyglucuronate dehydrogenase
MIRVAVAGLGRIGARNDFDPPSGVARSHVGAVLANREFRIVAVVEPNRRALEDAVGHWPHLQGSARLVSLDELDAGAAEVIVIASPSGIRDDAIVAAIARKPRIVVVEKPFARDLSAGRTLAAAAQRARVPLLVTGRYSKGLRNYASHAVDLLLDWFGEIVEVQAFGSGQHGDDRNISFRCAMAAGFDAVLLGMDGTEYDQFELELYFADRRIELANGGVEKRIARAVPDLHYSGYAQLGGASPLVPSSLVGGMTEFYRAVADHLTSGAALGGCDEIAALSGLAALDAAVASLAGGGRALRPDSV